MSFALIGLVVGLAFGFIARTTLKLRFVEQLLTPLCAALLVCVGTEPTSVFSSTEQTGSVLLSALVITVLSTAGSVALVWIFRRSLKLGRSS